MGFEIYSAKERNGYKLKNPHQAGFFLKVAKGGSIAAKEISGQQFSLGLVSKNSNNPSTINTQIEELVKELQKTTNVDFDKLLVLLSLHK